MKIYPDLRITQEQYENWHNEIARRDWEREIYRQCDEEDTMEYEAVPEE